MNFLDMKHDIIFDIEHIKTVVNKELKKYKIVQIDDLLFTDDIKKVINIHLDKTIKTDDDFKNICENINTILSMYNINYYYTKKKYSVIYEYYKIYHTNELKSK